MSHVRLLSTLLLLCVLSRTRASDCANFQDNERFDCDPDANSNQQACQARGCCWQLPRSASTSGDVNVPYCFFPRDFPSYHIASVPFNDSGTVIAQLVRDRPSGRPDDVNQVRLRFLRWGPTCLRVRLETASKRRWEPPIPLYDPPTAEGSEKWFDVSLRSRPFGITVRRKRDGLTMLDTASVAAPLIFADQFLQLSTRLPPGRVFGLGEQRRNFSHDLSGWQRIALWARDQPPSPHVNLYGVHNLLLSVQSDGSAFGLFLLNSNAQEVLLQPLPAVTYRSVGGIIDLFVLAGPSPAAVVAQYYGLIGRPTLPPLWSLGFHLCRWGFTSTDMMNSTLQRNLKANMPMDVLWNDIDYMDSYKDWTLDTKKFAELPSLVKQLHAGGMRYVMIVDAGIAATHYPAYDSGISQRVFILGDDGKPLVGKVWPGAAVFPDFTAPQTQGWWSDQASHFHDTLPFDGCWIDMNEPSSFVVGSVNGCPKGNNLDFPPYTPWVLDHSLIAKTICASAKQNLSTHYNLHSMFGYYEAKATHAALKKIAPTKRPFILSRSTFAGSGRFTFHWTGDNTATWDAMRASIVQILNFNLFAIPMVGADICGFNGNSNEELCTRWMQLGAFYPFMRSHNTIGNRDQDPASWSVTAQASMRDALRLRYSLMPYLYTQLFSASSAGTPVARPLFLDFSTDKTTHGVDQQFLLGPALLVSPALYPGVDKVSAYLPDAPWYDLRTGIAMSTRGKFVTLPAPLSGVSALLRGGFVVPTRQPAANTAAQRGTPFGLIAGLDDAGSAVGELFDDDGETELEKGALTLVSFSIKGGRLLTTPKATAGGAASLGSLRVSGVTGTPRNVTVNDVAVKFTFDSGMRILSVPEMNADLLKVVTVEWK